MSCSVAQIIVPSCVGGEEETQKNNINVQKEKNTFTFKVADNK
jgi:hypothetical protein